MLNIYIYKCSMPLLYWLWILLSLDMLPTFTFYTTESTKVSPRKKLFVSFCLSFKDKSQVHHAPNCRVLSVYRLQKNNDDIFYGAKNKLPTKFRTDVNIKDRHVLLLYLPADKNLINIYNKLFITRETV